MKSNISHIIMMAFIISLTMLTMTGCLDEDPKDRIDETEAYGTADNLMKNTVATLYNYIGGNAESQGLQGTYRGVYDLNTFTTDEAVIPIRGGDWYDGGFWHNLYLHTWTANDDALNNTWNYLYKVVMQCNKSLATLSRNKQLLTTEQYIRCNAEVRGLRALYYFYLMDLYGNVPLVINDSTKLYDVRQNGRSKVFQYLITDLSEIADKLPTAFSNQEGVYYGRFTAPVAHFLLAKLFLNAEIYNDDNWTDGIKPNGADMKFDIRGSRMNAWQACIHYCDMLYEDGYRLESKYQQNFAVHNETSQENIFTIPMDKNLYSNLFLNLFRSRHYNHGSAYGMDAENGSCATRSTVLTYGYGSKEVDKRYVINFFSDTVKVDGNVVRLDNGDALIYRPLEVQPDLTGSAYEKTAGARMAKYEIDRQAYSDGKLQSNDIVLFRYADALLMKAEAKVRNGEDGSSELNQVRARAGMPDRSASLDHILEERLLELMWEGWRRNDLIRFGLFGSPYDMRPQLQNESSGYTTVFPIPKTALELNGNLKQNKGYEAV